VPRAIPPDCEDGINGTADACDGVLDACVRAASDGLCDDGAFCNGAATCSETAGCEPGAYACSPAEWCDEFGDACVAHGDGDFEPDGDVDLQDFYWCQLCLTQSAAAPGCAAANLTGPDAQIDTADVEAFVEALTGP
jgi:hypothetical protein